MEWNAVNDKAEDRRPGYKLLNTLLPSCVYIWTCNSRTEL